MKDKDELTVRELREHAMATERPMLEAIADRAYRRDERLDELRHQPPEEQQK